MATTAVASERRGGARRMGARASLPAGGDGGSGGGGGDDGVDHVETNGDRQSLAMTQPRQSAPASNAPRPKYRYVTSVHSKYVALTSLGLTLCHPIIFS